MYQAGLDIDSRAYFTAACGISSYTFLSVNTPSKLKHNKSAGHTVAGQPGGAGSALLACSKDYLGAANAVIEWNTPQELTSMFYNTRQTKVQLNAITITPRQRSILIGKLLSDAWKQSRPGWNPRIAMKQSIVNFNYLWLTFIEKSSLCGAFPYPSSNIKRGKRFYALTFQSRQLKTFRLVRSLLYKETKGKVFQRSIQEDQFYYLDYIALAHWIKGDGAKHNRGLILCTDGFSIKETILLMNILRLKFDISPTLYKCKGLPRIHIFKRDMLKIRPFIQPYFVKSFLYKIYQ